MSGPAGILDEERRSVTLGSLLVVSLIAFDQLGLAAIAPQIASELEGFGLYSWIFSAFFLAQVVGTVAAGQFVDRSGLARPFVVAIALFGAGLLLGDLASTMPLFVVSRAIQGLGGGALGVCVYAITDIAYPDNLRPRMLAAISSAFVLPALMGPTLAGIVAEQLNWRVVFYGLLAFLGAVWFLAMPAYRGVSVEKQNTEGDAGGDIGTREPRRIPTAVVLAIGTALLFGGLEVRNTIIGLPVSILGFAVAWAALRRLLPKGTLVAQRGLPATVAARGLFVASYFYTEVYLVLTLVKLAHYQTVAAGLAISGGSLSWTAATWLGARLDTHDGVVGHRRPRVLVGIGIMTLGICAIALPILLGETPNLAHSLTYWIITGFGMGLANPTTAEVAFVQSPVGREGSVSSSILLADLFTPAVAISVGGAVIEYGRSSAGGLQPGLIFAFGLAVALICCAMIVSLRLPRG